MKIATYKPNNVEVGQVWTIHGQTGKVIRIENHHCWFDSKVGSFNEWMDYTLLDKNGSFECLTCKESNVTKLLKAIDDAN